MSALLDVEAAAAYLACSERHVRRLVAEKRLAVVKVGTLARFTTEDLDAYIDAARTPAVSPEPVPDSRGLRRRNRDRRHLHAAAASSLPGVPPGASRPGRDDGTAESVPVGAAPPTPSPRRASPSGASAVPLLPHRR